MPATRSDDEHRENLGTEWLVNQIAHALRNPIFAALVQTESITTRAGQSPEILRSAEILFRQLKRLEADINEMLLFGRPARLSPGSVRVSDLVGSVRDRLGQRSGAGEAEIVTTTGDPELTARWDARAVEVILERLVTNAIEHTDPPHRVDIEVSYPSPERIAITVRDQGEGMPEEIRLRATVPFFPQHRGRPGLGLAIADKLARAMGGALEVSSEPGHGTEVRLILPTEVAQEPG